MALLTPIVKAFITDNGWIATSHCMQVFGGHGYIREWGMEQFVRDARINMIYEGTNTIQSLDLLGRKVLGDNGAKLKKFGKLVADFVEEEGTNEAMQEFVNPLADLGDKLTKLTTELGMKAFGNADEVGAAAVDYLRVCGHLVFAYFWARMAKVALAKQGGGDPFYKAKLATARFYFAKLLPETAGLIRSARAGAAADGDGRGAVLKSGRPDHRTKSLRRTMSMKKAALGHRRLGLRVGRGVRPGHARRSVEDDRRREQAGEVATSASSRRQACCQGKIEKMHRPGQAGRRCATKCEDARKDQPILGMAIVERRQEARRRDRTGTAARSSTRTTARPTRCA